MTVSPLQLRSMHHVSSVSANIKRSRDFYTRVLGMRPIITTVNQDDPRMYHLFFGDGEATPGSDMTVFDIPNAARELRGNNSIALTSFRVSGAYALRYWVERLNELGIPNIGVTERDGRSVLDFDDFEGTQLSLIDDGGVGESFPWHESAVPAEFQIRGLGYITIVVPDREPTHEFLTLALGLTHHHAYPLAEAPEFSVHVYSIGAGGPNAEVHVIVRDDLPRARYGAGGVHHVALLVPDDQKMSDWVAKLALLGFHNSGIVDRHYFQSIYVREPNHVLFELATAGPGFEVDGPIDEKRVSLPPFLEPRRAEIVRALQPLNP
ncbi:MAG: VOC family protein [Phycisphaerae bacterium]|nr:VOC family protein [Gemmatimonadaceae bacterium]